MSCSFCASVRTLQAWNSTKGFSKRKHALTQATLSAAYSLWPCYFHSPAVQSTVFNPLSSLFSLFSSCFSLAIAKHCLSPSPLTNSSIHQCPYPIPCLYICLCLCADGVSLCHPSLRSVCCIPPCSPTCLAVLPLCSLSWKPGAPCATHCRGV